MEEEDLRKHCEEQIRRGNNYWEHQKVLNILEDNKSYIQKIKSQQQTIKELNKQLEYLRSKRNLKERIKILFKGYLGDDE